MNTREEYGRLSADLARLQTKLKKIRAAYTSARKMVVAADADPLLRKKLRNKMVDCHQALYDAKKLRTDKESALKLHVLKVHTHANNVNTLFNANFGIASDEHATESDGWHMYIDEMEDERQKDLGMLDEFAEYNTSPREMLDSL